MKRFFLQILQKLYNSLKSNALFTMYELPTILIFMILQVVTTDPLSREKGSLNFNEKGIIQDRVGIFIKKDNYIMTTSPDMLIDLKISNELRSRRVRL